MVEAPPADKADQLAWVARRTILELKASGAALDAAEIYAGIAATYEHYNLPPETMERLRIYIVRWVDRMRTQP